MSSNRALNYNLFCQPIDEAFFVSHGRVSARGVMGCRIYPSWWTHLATSCSRQCSTTGLTKAVMCEMVHIKDPVMLFGKGSLEVAAVGTTQIVRGNQLPPHWLLFPISSKGSFICIISQTG